MKYTIKGEYQLRVLHADGSLKHETEWFENLITDGGLDRLAAGACANYCRIGTGNTTPANTDSALVAQSASTAGINSVSSVNAGTPNYETTSTINYEFALGAVVGNMAEIGVGWAATGATLFSRALIVDGGGSPTTVTVLVTEILQVNYRTTVYQTRTDVTVNTSIGGVAIDCTSRPSQIASASWNLATGGPFSAIVIGYNLSAYVTNGVLGAITAAGPTGTQATISTYAWASYTNGNHYHDFTMSLAIGTGNVAGGISAMQLAFTDISSGSASYHWQIGFSPAIAKDNTKQMTLTCRVSWARH